MKKFSTTIKIIVIFVYSIAYASSNDIPTATEKNSPEDIIYPKGDVNDTSRPQIKWVCSPGYTEAKVKVVDLKTGSPIYELDWNKFSTYGGSTCSLNEQIGKKIIPPIPRPAPCRTPGCINFLPPRHIGLEDGDYQLQLQLRGGEHPEKTLTSHFSIIENFRSNFSLDAEGWTPISGKDNWLGGGGQYMVSGDTKGAPWMSIYTLPIMVNSWKNQFEDGRKFSMKMSPGCFNENCYAGIVTYMREIGATGGVKRYSRYEIVISGDSKLHIRSVRDGFPTRELLSKFDISKYVKGKTSYTLTVHQSSPQNYGSTRVLIDNDLVYCDRPLFDLVSGYAGIIFSSRESSDSLSVDEFTVSPTKYMYIWQCEYQFPD
jgi:hypothetical protein